MNPIDAVLEHAHLQKTAGPMDWMRGAAHGLTSITGHGDVPARYFGPRLPGVLKTVSDGVDAGRSMQTALGVGAATAVGGAAITGVGVAAKKIYDSIQSRRVFKEMVQLAPELAAAREENPQMFNATYNALRRLNPVFAGDPLVAGALMKKMMGPEADATSRMQTIVSGIKPPEAPKSQFMVAGKFGPLQVAHSL